MLGEPLDEARQLVILVDSLPSELISSIVGNFKDATLIEVKENLLMEYERQDMEESTERAFKVKARRFKGGQGNSRNGRCPRRNADGS